MQTFRSVSPGLGGYFKSMATPRHTACGSAALPVCTALNATMCPWDPPAKVPIIPHPEHFPAWEWKKGTATAQDILHQTDLHIVRPGRKYFLFQPLMHIKITQKFNGKLSDFFLFLSSVTPQDSWQQFFFIRSVLSLLVCQGSYSNSNFPLNPTF